MRHHVQNTHSSIWYIMTFMLTVIVILHAITTSLQGLELHPFLTWILQDLGLFAVVIQSLSQVQLLATPWTAAHQSSLPFTISRSLLKLTSIESVMPSNHLILCCPLLLLPSIFPSIRVSCSEAALCIRWPNRHFIFDISPSNVHSGLISFRIDWFISLQSKGLSRVFSSTSVQRHQSFGAQPFLLSSSHVHT